MGPSIWSGCREGTPSGYISGAPGTLLQGNGPGLLTREKAKARVLSSEIKLMG